MPKSTLIFPSPASLGSSNARLNVSWRPIARPLRTEISPPTAIPPHKRSRLLALSNEDPRAHDLAGERHGYSDAFRAAIAWAERNPPGGSGPAGKGAVE